MNKEKIQKVIAKMLAESEEIKSVTRESISGSEEYYFTYPDNKYQWSVLKSSDVGNYMFYYPSTSNRSEFLRFDVDEMDESSKKNFNLLFEDVQGKIFGFDSILDDILD